MSRTKPPEFAPPEVVEFGPQHIGMVEHGVIVPFRQIRVEIEQDPLDELKRSIRSVDQDGRDTYNLVNPLVVAELDEAHAQNYLDDLNSLWKTDYTLDGLPRHPETGDFMFLIAGHRRWLGVSQIIAEDGLDPRTTRVSVSMQRNISFAQALVLQLQENTYLRPSPVDQAEAIRAAYDFFRARDARFTKKGLSVLIGRSYDVVADALLYSDLPDEVKAMVGDKAISYTLAVTLSQIRNEFVKRFPLMRDEGMLAPTDNFANAQEYANHEIETLAITYRALLQRHRRLTSKVYQRAHEFLQTLRQQSIYQQQGFDLDLQVESAVGRRAAAELDLGKVSAYGLAMALRRNPQLLKRLQTSDPKSWAVVRKALEELEQETAAQAAQDSLFD